MLKVSIKVLFFILLLSSCGGGGSNSPTPTPTPQANQDYFIHLTDIHLQTKTSKTQYGGDTGTELWEATKTKLNKIINSSTPPKFILYTGDSPAHSPGNNRVPYIENVLESLHDLATPKKIPLLFTPGNNDSLDGNYYPFTGTTVNTIGKTIFTYSKNLYNNDFPALNTVSSCGLAPCMVLNDVPSMGYYSVMPVDGLRVIVLNSVMFDRRYTDLSNKNAARTMQMHWLASQLLEAENHGDKVAIAMHIPPGTATTSDIAPATSSHWESSSSLLNQFLTLTELYQNTITGIFYGHTHQDELKRLYDAKGAEITAVAFSAPGISPIFKNNPGFKTVFYNSGTKEFMDSTTHYTTPNATSTTKWKEYKFSTAYNCPLTQSMLSCLKGKSLAELTTSMNGVYNVKSPNPHRNITGSIDTYFK